MDKETKEVEKEKPLWDKNLELFNEKVKALKLEKLAKYLGIEEKKGEN